MMDAGLCGCQGARVLEELRALGLLMMSDAAFPSLATLVAGEPVRGSWWGHPRGRQIYEVADAVGESPDVMATRLIQGKLTFVHRVLWDSVIAVGTAGASWQVAGLAPDARRIRRRLEKAGLLRADEVGGMAAKAAGKAMTELEVRLLTVGGQVHTDSGRHVKAAESWAAWMASRRFRPRQIDSTDAVLEIEERSVSAGGEASLKRLPWRRLTGRR